MNINAVEGFCHGTIKRRIAVKGTVRRSNEYTMEEIQYILMYLNFTQHTYSHTFLITAFFVQSANPCNKDELPMPRFENKDFTDMHSADFLIDKTEYKGQTLFLVKWSHFSYIHSTWELPSACDGFFFVFFLFIFLICFFFVYFFCGFYLVCAVLVCVCLCVCLFRLLSFFFCGHGRYIQTQKYIDVLIQEYEGTPVEKQDIIRRRYNKALAKYEQSNMGKRKNTLSMPISAIKKLTNQNKYNRGAQMNANKLIQTARLSDGFLKGCIRSQSSDSIKYNVTIKINDSKNGIIDKFCSCPFCDNSETICKHIVAILLHVSDCNN